MCPEKRKGKLVYQHNTKQLFKIDNPNHFERLPYLPWNLTFGNTGFTFVIPGCVFGIKLLSFYLESGYCNLSVSQNPQGAGVYITGTDGTGTEEGGGKRTDHVITNILSII